MLDLSLAIQDLKHVQEAHIVSVNNECKELLLILGHNIVAAKNIPIHCINLQTKDGRNTETTGQFFTFTREQEQSSPSEYAGTLDKYLYDPTRPSSKQGLSAM